MNPNRFSSILTGVGWPSRNSADPIKLVGFTSCGFGHGVSTVAGNVAAAVAVSGQQALLVDCDFSRPSLHRAFDRTLAPGLADLLGDRPESEMRIQETSVPNLRLLSAGSSNPSPTWDEDLVRTALRRIEPEIDLVVCDIPVLGTQEHSAPALAFMDRVLVVIDSRRTSSNQLADYRHRMSRLGVAISGVVLNRARSILRDAVL